SPRSLLPRLGPACAASAPGDSRALESARHPRRIGNQPSRIAGVASDPLAQLAAWLAEAGTAGVAQPEAMCLATASAEGAPSARMVLLRDLDERGLVFHTNE